MPLILRELLFKNIAKIVEEFEKIKSKEKWGTNLPYMISGSTKTPQANAMQLIRSKRYNLGDIITYLSKKKSANITVKKKLLFEKKIFWLSEVAFQLKKT